MLLRTLRVVVATVLSFVFAVTTVSADAVSDFYKGKTLSLIVPLAPGGSYSLFAQLLLQHLPRHIPGNPTVIVQHMPGAGGVTAANYLYNVAPKDGTVLATFNSAASTYAVLNPDKISFDPLQFTWLSGWNETVTVLVVLENSPAQTLEEARQKEIIIGSVGAGSLTYMLPALLNTYAGTKFKIVTGYPGANNVYLAMEQGEVHGSTALAESLNASRQEWVQKDRMRFLVQIARKPYSEKMKDVPLLDSLATNEESRQVFEFLSAGSMAARSIQLPPGVPADRVVALKKALDDTYADPQFLADAKRQMFEIDPVPAEEIMRKLRAMANLPVPLKEKLRVLLGS